MIGGRNFKLGDAALQRFDSDGKLGLGAPSGVINRALYMGHGGSPGFGGATIWVAGYTSLLA